MKIFAALLSVAMAGMLAGPAPRAASFGVSEAAASAGNNAPPAGLQPTVTIDMRAGFSSIESSGRSLLPLPDVWSSVVIRSDSRVPCASGLTMAAPGGDAGLDNAASADDAVVWKIQARLVSVLKDTATVRLRWSRTVNHPAILPGDSITVERDYLLTDGRKGVLDLVTAPPGSGQCESFAVLIGLQFSPIRPVRFSAVSYDLWLVQEEDGTVTTDRFQTSGSSGDTLNYFFRPLLYDGSGARVASKMASQFSGYFYGTVRGTVVDGSIDILLDGNRTYSEESLGIGSGGRKRVLVHDGETIEFELPGLPPGRLPHVGDLTELLRRSHSAIRLTPRILW